MLGGIPTSSVKRLLKVPSDERPTAKQTSVSHRQQQPRPAGQFPDPIAAMPHDLVPANSAGAVSDTACAHFTKNRLVSEEIGNFGFETKLLLADITFVSKAIA